MTQPIIKTDDFEIWRIIDTESDGCVPTDTFPNADKTSIAANKNWLYPHYVDARDNLIMATQSFLVKTKDTVILVDGSVGNDKVRYTFWANNLKSEFLSNLRATGITEESVKAVLTTHFHFDHLGWYTRLKDGEMVPTFPNAKYYFVKDEYDYWKNTIDPKSLDNNIAILDSVEPVILAKQASFIPKDFHLSEGIYLEPMPGHTPGNVMVHVKFGNIHVILAGDILHNPIQFTVPSWSASNFDDNPERALQTRIDFINKYANSETIIIGSHFASHPAGMIKEKDGKRIFVPVVR